MAETGPLATLRIDPRTTAGPLVVLRIPAIRDRPAPQVDAIRQPWQFVLATRDGLPIGELTNIRPQALRFGLGGADSFTWTMSPDHPLAAAAQDTGRTLVKVYQGAAGSRIIRLVGPVVNRDKARSSGGGTIGLTAASPYERLRRRRVGWTGDPISVASPSSLRDRSEIVWDIVDGLNKGSVQYGTAADDTGIRRGLVSAASGTYLAGVSRRRASELISEITADGPEFRVRAIEPVRDSIGLALAQIDIGPALGTARPEVIFEFGGNGRLNVAEWRDVGDASTIANDVAHVLTGDPASAGDPIVVSDGDTASRALYGRAEELVEADLTTLELRQRLLAEHVRIRRVPRRVITFTPVAEDPLAAIEERRVPRLFVDYNPGDTVRFRATERQPVYDAEGTVIGQRDTLTVDAMFRVYSVTLNFDDQGTATPSLTLLEEGS